MPHNFVADIRKEGKLPLNYVKMTYLKVISLVIAISLFVSF